MIRFFRRRRARQTIMQAIDELTWPYLLRLLGDVAHHRGHRILASKLKSAGEAFATSEQCGSIT